MDNDRFWQLIDQARRLAADPADAGAVATHATTLLADHQPAQILQAEQILWDLMAASYLAPLWAAAYQINGGCSDDGFDYFRGWLIAQGRATFEQVINDPDSLADLPAVKQAAAKGWDLEGEAILPIVWNAYRAATGSEPPADNFTIRYPELDPEWDFDFGDHERIARLLPRTAALYPA
ncbi:DUF4240 domain-containing protein [Streptomyces sp. SID8379]|nr:DUF4240 domain-containing protein [Streptomyces sp. SID8379]MYW62487.1 DUF4240 domain-containing protein [Streptomyces sp. SID8379]